MDESDLKVLGACIVCAVLLVAVRARAADAPVAKGPSRQPAVEIKWPPATESAQPGAKPLPGLQSKVIYGDATRPELYSILFKAAPNIRLTAHSHPDERSCFVTSGVWYFGYGEKWAEQELKALPAGSHYTEPANAAHFAGTKQQGATVECTAMGPSGTQPIE
jgi:quercetin dioxygenase-like cupin family protein